MDACDRCAALKGKIFNRVVEVQQATEARDDFGQPIETWVTIRTVKADRKDVRAWERFRSDQELAARTSVFTMRWFSGLDAKMRLSHDGLIWDIEGLAELGRRVALEVTATAARI